MMQLINKIKGWFIMTEQKLLVICVTIVLMTAIGSVGMYSLQKDRLMSANIENGIVKGIDPIAIKCAYESSGSMCMVYAATKHGDSAVGRK
jgi:hypothetical protein